MDAPSPRGVRAFHHGKKMYGMTVSQFQYIYLGEARSQVGEYLHATTTFAHADVVVWGYIL